MGSADFRFGDDDVFEDENNIGAEPTHSTPGPTELENSDFDTDPDDDDAGLSESNMGEVSDTFETNADLNTAEYSECTINLAH